MAANDRIERCLAWPFEQGAGRGLRRDIATNYLVAGQGKEAVTTLESTADRHLARQSQVKRCSL